MTIAVRSGRIPRFHGPSMINSGLRMLAPSRTCQPGPVILPLGSGTCCLVMPSGDVSCDLVPETHRSHSNGFSGSHQLVDNGINSVSHERPASSKQGRLKALRLIPFVVDACRTFLSLQAGLLGQQSAPAPFERSEDWRLRIPAWQS